MIFLSNTRGGGNLRTADAVSQEKKISRGQNMISALENIS
jgi:hypothetical protein